MDIGFKHTHTLVVVLFLLFFVFKAVLLFLGKTELLNKIREKTKVVDIVLGVLLLVTGGYLLYRNEFPLWAIIKLVVFVALVPLSIIGLKKENKVLVGIAVVGFLLTYRASEVKSWTMMRPKYDVTAETPSSERLALSKRIFVEQCANCHGEDGKAMKFGSKNIALSQLSKEEIMSIIKNGKGLMPKFAHLSEEEIVILAEYCETLRE